MPVQFCLLSLDDKQCLSEELQGFTSNVGKEGICLTVNNLEAKLAEIIKEKKAKFSLGIDLPLTVGTVGASATIVWMQKLSAGSDKYLIGLKYEHIDRGQNNKIMLYARGKKLFIPTVLIVIILLSLSFALASFVNIKLIERNKALVKQLVNTIQELNITNQKAKGISKQSEALQLEIKELQLRIQSAQNEAENLAKNESKSLEKIKGLNSLIARLMNDKASLQQKLAGLQKQEDVVTQELLRLDKKKTGLEKANIDKMYDWLKIHQNPRTGLVMSFEGDNDIANCGFTYDQALVIQAYTYFGDFERAKKILDFFDKKAKYSKEGLFYNAYYTSDTEPTEYIVHSGPNIWLGIAVLQYTKKTGDTQYLRLAQGIADSLIVLQDQDKEGYIRGGPNVEWVATEHNLDAYAFFNMLYKITRDFVYLEKANKVLNWLVKHTYDNKDIPVKRGKGDSTIATDTYAWSLAAIGPKKLEGLGLNPERILEFAENNCAVEVNYTRPEGRTTRIKGFDFTAQRNLARGGVVSAEWTAQMIEAFKIMADFYARKGIKPKAHIYEMKAEEYMTQLGNMIISSPSPSGQGESCLPYATQDFVDTGHGWMTPKGKSTGSLSATTYGIFAYYNYNPLELKE